MGCLCEHYCWGPGTDDGFGVLVVADVAVVVVAAAAATPSGVGRKNMEPSWPSLLYGKLNKPVRVRQRHRL
jgi:hypothetical protein